MIKNGQLIPLRRFPPSSEKMSHRRHRRNEARYAPAMSARVVTPMTFASAYDSILSTTSGLTLVLFVLQPVEPVFDSIQKVK